MKVTDLHLVLDKRTESKNESWKAVGNKRIDVYFSGTIKIDNKELPIKVHLMNADGSIKEQRNKWNISGDIGKGSDECQQCNGLCCHTDQNFPPPAGETAIEVAKVVKPFIEQQGYVLITTRRCGGWYLFFCHCDTVGEAQFKPSRKRFYTDIHSVVDCPIHGKVKKVETEYAG